MDLALDDERVDDLADVVDADVLAHRRRAGLGVDLHGAQVGAVREGEVDRVVGGVGVDARLGALGQVVRGEGREGDVGDADALVGALDAEPAAGELEVVDVGLEQVRGEDLGLLDHLVGRQHQRPHRRRRASGSRRCPSPLGHDRGVAVQHLDVLERDAQPVGDDLAPGRLVPLAVRGGAGEHLDLAGGQHPDAGVLPAAGAVAQRAEHARRRQAAHLGERRDADAELDRVVALATRASARRAARRSRRSPWPWRWRPRSCRSRRSCRPPW